MILVAGAVALCAFALLPERLDPVSGRGVASLAMGVAAFGVGGLAMGRRAGRDGSGRDAEGAAGASPGDAGPAAPDHGAGGRDAELAALRQEVADARDELDAFNYSVSHDLRSPIGAILNFTTVLQEDFGEELDPEAREILDRIRRSADSALALLDGLLRFSRIGRQEMRPVALDPAPLVREAWRLVRPTGPAAATVELHVGALPEVTADAALLRAAFVELLGNAVKFGRGREKLIVSVDGRREEDGTVLLRVADDGAGFDPRWTGKLFRVFERLHSRDEFPGAGLGLAAVRRIVERHGGRVWAESPPGEGARFHLVLPPGPEAETEREDATRGGP